MAHSVEANLLDIAQRASAPYLSHQEAVAVLVGLFGLSSSLGAIVLARRREFGVLRHLGLTRRQIGAMLAAEGGLLALLGAAAGLVSGAAISLVLIHVVNRQSFNWSMELHAPWPLLRHALRRLATAKADTWLRGLAALYRWSFGLLLAVPLLLWRCLLLPPASRSPIGRHRTPTR